MSEKNENDQQLTVGSDSNEGLGAAKPCPFCGAIGEVAMHEGTSFRWRYIGCGVCGAQAGEVRIQTCGDGTHEEWAENAKKRALEEWNARA